MGDELLLEVTEKARMSREAAAARLTTSWAPSSPRAPAAMSKGNAIDTHIATLGTFPTTPS